MQKFHKQKLKVKKCPKGSRKVSAGSPLLKISSAPIAVKTYTVGALQQLIKT